MRIGDNVFRVEDVRLIEDIPGGGSLAYRIHLADINKVIEVFIPCDAEEEDECKEIGELVEAWTY